ncbi:peptidoglycan-binding protein LysM [Calderihabitans maritimus]|uniref:Peptidoglycan-binding protein LysM n=1 Tax=Calderihabitans maritimus TaxID=1246530 RepID=A0A1Z5HWD9_9FIRM|nr:peptidoglycan-binding protein LysM [Calderihabitans maritimus]
MLQLLLTRAGFDPGPIDGIFGPRTEAAVKAFQRQKGLPVTGVVDTNTWIALIRDAV